MSKLVGLEQEAVIKCECVATYEAKLKCLEVSMNTYITLPCVVFPPVSQPLVRLAGGPTPGEGRVEVYYNGSYGTICQSGWDLMDATVVCNSLGYAGALIAMGGAAYGPGSGQVC